MTAFDRITLGATGLVALYLVIFFAGSRRATARNGAAGAKAYPILYAAAFAVVLAAGLLLVVLGYGVLSNPLVVIVAALIPLCLSAGLVGELAPAYERAYWAFGAFGLAGIALTRFLGPAGVGTAVLAAVHSVAGLVIFALPLVACRRTGKPWSFSLVTVGGTLIGIGGIALAFLKAGRPILPATVIFTILAPLLFLMTVCFALGFVLGGKEGKTRVGSKAESQRASV